MPPKNEPAKDIPITTSGGVPQSSLSVSPSGPSSQRGPLAPLTSIVLAAGACAAAWRLLGTLEPLIEAKAPWWIYALTVTAVPLTLAPASAWPAIGAALPNAVSAIFGKAREGGRQ